MLKCYFSNTKVGKVEAEGRKAAIFLAILDLSQEFKNAVLTGISTGQIEGNEGHQKYKKYSAKYNKLKRILQIIDHDDSNKIRNGNNYLAMSLDEKNPKFSFFSKFGYEAKECIRMYELYLVGPIREDSYISNTISDVGNRILEDRIFEEGRLSFR